MATYYKYEKYQKYINGVPQDEYKQGNLIGTGEYNSLQDCEEGVIYKWVDSGETICDGYKLCVKEIKWKSTDGGNTWVNTSETRAGTVIDMWSTECGYNPIYDWIATGKYTCNNGFESEEFVWSKSLDGGETWEIVEPAQYKYEEKFLSNRCMQDVEPFTFVYDTTRPGGSLTMVNQISYWDGGETAEKVWFPDGTEGSQIRAIGIFETTRKFYCRTKYIIDWGDGSDLEIYEKTNYSSDTDTFIKNSGYTYPPEVVGDFEYKKIDITSHNYTNDGKYIIKVWGFINSVDIIADELISWGESGITNYTLPPETFDEKYPDGGWILKIVGAEYLDYLRFSGIISLDVIKEFPPLTRPILNKKEFVNDNNPAYPWLISPQASKFPIQKPFRWSVVGAYPSFFLKNCQVTEFDFVTEVSAVGLSNLPNLTRTPLFVEGQNRFANVDGYAIANCPSITKAGPFSPAFIGRTAPGVGAGVEVSQYDFFEMLYKSSPNITEIDFGYCAFSDKQNWLKKFNSLTTLKGYLYKSAYPKDSDPILSFAEMFSGNNKLRSIQNLTILSGDCTGMFRNTDYITGPCKFDKISNYDPEIHESIIADDMFYNSKMIYTADLDRLAGVTSAEGMFRNCPKLTTVIGEYPEGLVNMDYMFSGCQKLTSISPIFKNYTGELPKAKGLFSGCQGLETIPEDFFNIEGTGYPMGMFINVSQLKNYPKINNLPVWEWDRFKYNGQMATTCCFFGCHYIRTQVPAQWGGATAYDRDYLVIEVKAGTYYNPNRQRPGSVLVMFDSNFEYITPSNDSLVCTAPTQIYVRYAENADAYLPYTGEIPSDVYIKLLTPGRFINSFDYYSGHEATYCHGVKGIDGTYFQGSNIYRSTTLLDLAPYSSCNYIVQPQNILTNCRNVTEIKNFNFYGSHLPTETRQQLLSPIKTLVTIDNFCDTSTTIQGACNGEGNVTTTLGLFKNNPNLVSAKWAFQKQPITTLDSDEFDNCTKLENIFGVFLNCTSLTNVPTFNGAKNIKDFSYAFSGCTSLTGSTPVDENGYKLWERAGKEGYPATINGEHCFRGCTQLDDYNEIPDNWK